MKLTPRLSAVTAAFAALCAGPALGVAAAPAATAVTGQATAPAAPAVAVVRQARAVARPITLIRRNKITVGESDRHATILPAGPLHHALTFHAATPLRPTRYRAATHLYRVRVRILDRNGDPVGPTYNRPAYSVIGPVVNTATAATPASIGYDRALGAYSMRLPAGDYYTDGFVTTPGYSAVVVQPGFSVTGDTTITLDARAAAPVSVKVDHPGASPLLEYAEIDQTVDGTPVSSSWGVENSPGQPLPFYLTPTAAVTGRPFLFSLHASLTSRSAFPTGKRSQLRPASYEYNLLFTHPGAVPATLAYRVGEGQVATVATRYYGETSTLPKDDIAQQGNLPEGPGNDEADSYDAPVVIAPMGRATMYYAAPPGFAWNSEDLLDDDQAGPSDLQPDTSYQPGRYYTDSFGEAALGAAGAASRTGNVLEVFPAPFSPSEPGHVLPACCSLSFDGSKVRSTLWLNGKVLTRSSDPAGFASTVPAARGRYTLTETATRPPSDWSVLGTRSSATWSFFSAKPPGTASLPLLSTRISGPFSSWGSVPAGQQVPLSVNVENFRNAQSSVKVAVAASFDGGQTWLPVSLRRAGPGWLALLTTPSGSGYVSLRTSASDSAGDTAIVSTTRAFAFTAQASRRRRAS